MPDDTTAQEMPSPIHERRVEDVLQMPLADKNESHAQQGASPLDEPDFQYNQPEHALHAHLNDDAVEQNPSDQDSDNNSSTADRVR
jgi:hypothetical protein